MAHSVVTRSPRVDAITGEILLAPDDAGRSEGSLRGLLTGFDLSLHVRTVVEGRDVAVAAQRLRLDEVP